MLHTMVTEGGVSHMSPVMQIPIPEGDTVHLRPGEYHVMVSNLVRKWEVGDTVNATLRFARAGVLSVAVPVRTYTEVVERLDQGN